MAESVAVASMTVLTPLVLELQTVLNAGVVRLFEDSPDILPPSLISAFTEAAWVGYAPWPTPAFTGPQLVPEEGREKLASGGMYFKWTGAVGSHIVRGWYITDTAGTEWYLAGRFTQPIILDAGNPTIFLVIETADAAEILRT